MASMRDMIGADRIARGLYWGRALTLVEGCSPVSEGCQHCWAAAQTYIRSHQRNEKLRARYDGLTNGRRRFNGIVRPIPEALLILGQTRTPTVFSVWNDLFHPDVPTTFIKKAFEAMAGDGAHHILLVLSKRPERMTEIFPTVRRGTLEFLLACLAHVWFGATGENQARLDCRYAALRCVQANLKFLSLEPLLERIVLPAGFEKHISWVVVGCETGLGARPCETEWIESIVEQCQTFGVPVFVKRILTHGSGGSMIPCADITEWPKHLQVREVPE